MAQTVEIGNIKSGSLELYQYDPISGSVGLRKLHKKNARSNWEAEDGEAIIFDLLAETQEGAVRNWICYHKKCISKAEELLPEHEMKQRAMAVFFEQSSGRCHRGHRTTNAMGIEMFPEPSRRN